MNEALLESNRRLLIIDGYRDIHANIIKILVPTSNTSALGDALTLRTPL